MISSRFLMHMFEMYIQQRVCLQSEVDTVKAIVWLSVHVGEQYAVIAEMEWMNFFFKKSKFLLPILIAGCLSTHLFDFKKDCRYLLECDSYSLVFMRKKIWNDMPNSYMLFLKGFHLLRLRGTWKRIIHNIQVLQCDICSV